jgi:hypothetical protein
MAEILTVRWTDAHLPPIYSGVGNSNSTVPPTLPASYNLAINATFAAGWKTMAGFLNGCFIFSVLSASNTSLYVSSRTLYGLAREIPDTNWVGRKLNKLSGVVRQTGVPAAALLFSAVSFFWLPFLQLKAGYAIQDVSDFLSTKTPYSQNLVDRDYCRFRQRLLPHCLGSAVLSLHPIRKVAADLRKRPEGISRVLSKTVAGLYLVHIPLYLPALDCVAWTRGLYLGLRFHKCNMVVYTRQLRKGGCSLRRGTSRPSSAFLLSADIDVAYYTIRALCDFQAH